jgi:hypothetical protein
MALLIHEGFEFKNILSGGYKIKENVEDVKSKQTMGDGSVRRNYGQMDKTEIKIKFGQLDAATFKVYMQHFRKHEDYYTYYSQVNDSMLTKKFFVSRPDVPIISSLHSKRYDEFEITLSQIGEGNSE